MDSWHKIWLWMSCQFAWLCEWTNAIIIPSSGFYAYFKPGKVCYSRMPNLDFFLLEAKQRSMILIIHMPIFPSIFCTTGHHIVITMDPTTCTQTIFDDECESTDYKSFITCPIIPDWDVKIMPFTKG